MVTQHEEERTDPVKRILELEEELNRLVDEAGLVPISYAQKVRDCTRAAIFSLIERGRLRSVKALGRTWVYADDVHNFERSKPGPRKGWSDREGHDEENEG
jgi:hypothetical protein